MLGSRRPAELLPDCFTFRENTGVGTTPSARCFDLGEIGCNPITNSPRRFPVDAIALKFFAEVNLRLSSSLWRIRHRDISKRDFAEIDLSRGVVNAFDRNWLLEMKFDMTFTRNIRQFFDKQISKTIGLPFFAMVLDSDESIGVGRVAKSDSLNSVDLNRN